MDKKTGASLAPVFIIRLRRAKIEFSHLDLKLKVI
jgi:hypothetical protein